MSRITKNELITLNALLAHENSELRAELSKLRTELEVKAKPKLYAPMCSLPYSTRKEAFDKYAELAKQGVASHYAAVPGGVAVFIH